MLKISRYFIISAFFIFVFLLFLLFSPDSYNIEPVFDVPVVIKNMSSSSRISGQVGIGDEYDIAIVADAFSNSEMLEYTDLTLSLLHQKYLICQSLYDAKDADVIIIATPYINEDDIMWLSTFLNNGKNVIFAVLPESMEEGMMKLLGITGFLPKQEVLGFDIYSEILLGGMFRSDEILLQCAEITLSGACKVFANGYDPERDTENPVINKEAKTPLIWRTYHNGGAIFVMNAPFLSDISGMGILTGILSLTMEEFIYPIIGTSSIVLDKFPYIGDNNTSIGARSCFRFTRDIIWPDLASISKNMNITLTCYTSGKFTENREAYDILKFIHNELYKENKGEIGYSSSDHLPSVIEEDMQFLSENFPLHVFRSFHGNETKLNTVDSNITSILTDDWNKAFSFNSEQTLMLPVISEGFGDEYTDLLLTSMVSSLGLILHRIDMEPIFTGNSVWNEYSLDISANLSNVFKQFKFLTPANVRTTSEAAKDYLNLKIDVIKNEREMSVYMYDNIDEISFLLRSSRKIDVEKSMNCSVLKVEDGVYLVRASGEKLTIIFSE